MNIQSGLMDFDTQNSRVGIGTTAPGGTFTVLSTSNGTTTSSSSVFTNNTLTSGTNAYISSSSITTGKLLDVNTGTSNTTQTTGNLVNITSTSTGLTTGGLLAMDWSPSSNPTTGATGDLFSLNLGIATSNFTGNLLNLKNNGTSVFSVSQTTITNAIPASFTAAGDVSIAYDINFTNPTASFIKSAAPLVIQSGEVFNSSNLSLKTFNQGTVVIDSGVTTGTSFDLTNAGLTTGTGFNAQFDGLTTGKGITITSTSTGVTTGSLLNVSTGTTGAVATNGIGSISATGAYTSTSNAGLLNLNASATTGGTVENLSAALLTTGVGLNISTAALTTGQAASITAGGATALTSGQGLLVTGPTGASAISANSGLVKIAAAGALTTQTVAGSGGLLDIQDNAIITGTLTSISDTAVMTGAGNLLNLTANAATTTTGLLTINGTGLTAGTC